MKAIIVKTAGAAPVFGEFREPVAEAGEVLLQVEASALSHVTKARASGKHYSSGGELPFVPGIDGVGRRVDSAQRVFFVLPRAPFGGMAERVPVPVAHCVPVPDGLDSIMAAALGNPGMSSWAALKERARLVAGETVLVNGATGAAGSLAVRIAKFRGARKVIATGRDPEALRRLAEAGADVTISLDQEKEALEATFEQAFAQRVDVVLDYLWGPSALMILIAAARAAEEAVPIRYVHIGASSASNIELPGAVLRSSALVLMGSGIGSISVDRLVAATGEVMQAAIPARLCVETEVVPFSEAEQAWNRNSGKRRLVFVPREMKIRIGN
jgi:NADPH:quinone reductase-like Zn-dependent oxidoreductase